MKKISMSNRDLFFRFLAQTSPSPLALEIVKAQGSWLYGSKGEKYLDLISGISVSNIGHRHPAVVDAIKEQVDKYMHLMVYGEYIQSPQVILADRLCRLSGMENGWCYLVNSGSEATEGAMKTAKRFTGRSEIISFKNAYHGSTQGALSIIGDDSFKNSFRPLIPGTRRIELNNHDELEHITHSTAAVFWEPVQGEAGVISTTKSFAKALAEKCESTGTLLIADEIQSGIGRTGKWFGFQHYNIKPDIFLSAKGLGGGMPVGAFCGRKEIMETLTENPVLGHITTFGGNPVSCAAAIATLNVIEKENLIETVTEKENQFLKLLNAMAGVKSVRSAGLLISLEIENLSDVQEFTKEMITHGVIADWFLFALDRIRIAPPLTITSDEIQFACEVIENLIKKHRF